MMFFFRRHAKPKAAGKSPPKTSTPPPDAVELRLQHLDYDLQSLSVEGLSHYIEPIVQDERFRIH